jgi:hypothetical protein
MNKVTNVHVLGHLDLKNFFNWVSLVMFGMVF